MIREDDKKSQVLFLKEMGPNLVRIINKLLSNQTLLRLLTYTDKDPLDPDKPNIKKRSVYQDGAHGNIRIVPMLPNKEDETSVLVLRVNRGVPASTNEEVLNIFFTIEIFVPMTQWVIKGDNLRPYAIMGEIQKSLQNEFINGLGTIRGSGFQSNFITEEMTNFMMHYTITQFN